MAIREDLVASATQFLQDPSVATSSVENRMQFLRSKNLTQEEIDAAMTKASGGAPPPSTAYSGSAPPQPYYPPYPPQNAWQPPQPTPRRDWRDWFIMATVVGGVGYGLYAMGKRYVYPLVAPPTPERLEQDKKSIDEKFDKAFAFVEQLSKDTEALKKAEQDRTTRLDATLDELESTIKAMRLANKRRDDDAGRVREEVDQLKSLVPKAFEKQEKVVDDRLREVNTELASLKTLLTQRVNANPLRAATNGVSPATNATAGGMAATVNTPENEPTAATPSTEAPKSYGAGSYKRPNLPGSSASGNKASIPAWQMAAASGGSSSSKDKDKEGDKEAEASASSSST